MYRRHSKQGGHMNNKSENLNSFRYQKEQESKSQDAVFHSPRKVDLSAANTTTEQEKLNRILKQPRSRMYLDLFEKVDLLSSTDEEIIEKLLEGREDDEIEELREMTDEEILEEIRQVFLEEFQELKDSLLDPKLLGVISKCYINGCDVHVITPEGTILNHFETEKDMPRDIAKGRKVYHDHQDCSCVEIYENCCRVILSSGEVITVKDNE
jgi:hypothetical protein